MASGSWGTFSPAEAEAIDERATLDEIRRERDQLRREVRELRAGAGAASEPEEVDRFGPGSDWHDRLQEARDLGDTGQLKMLYDERREARDREQEQREAAEQEQRRNEHPDVVEWDAQTQQLLESDDEAERAEGQRRERERRRHVDEVIRLATNRELDERVFALMDAEGRDSGYVAPGFHVDHDEHVKAARRELLDLERSGDDSTEAVRRRIDLERAIEERVAELTEDPRRASLPPGSQEIPSDSGAAPPQTIEGQLEAAFATGQATGDFSAWDRLATQASLERAGITS
ncbi:MAG: hypothetical protein JJT89_06555 [Nitriliruptoraceae bacterium]|nr:hypothetical protein [Nitriliruptoraceae bacterium]